MKFMEKAKRFFTLKRRANDGFTLVELIVVIAILAILAGVAVPAYSGYIKKAEKAGDMQLLAAVNDAFAAACMAENIDIRTLNTADAFIDIDDDGKVVLETILPENARDDFKMFYKGNEGTAFKVIDTLIFDAGEHVFIDLASAPNGMVTVSYGGKTISISTKAAEKMQNSGFGQNMGATALLDEVHGLANMLLATEDALLENDAYMRSLASYLKIDLPDNLEGEALLGYMEDKLVERGWNGDQQDAALANGAVIYAAERIQEMTPDQMHTILTSGDIYHEIEPNGGDEGLRLAQSAMAYGMYAAFVNNPEYNKNGAELATDNPMSALQAISNQENASYKDFQDYINSDAGKADMEAYMSAMSIVNDAKSEDATIEVLKNGFNDSELTTLLGQVLGKE